MKKLYRILIAISIGVHVPTWAKEVEDGGGHGDGHDAHHEKEGSANVGPNKGILEASAEDGIKLSPEALKNFAIRVQKLSGPAPWIIPASARLLSGEEVNLYRLRDGRYKRIDFEVLKRTGDQLTITSRDLRASDEIALSGIGFLRTAELAAFGGAPEGHSH
jgi:hypothetical protein